MPLDIRVNFYSPSPCSGSTRREHMHRKTIIICNSWAWLPNMASNRFYVPTFTSVLQQHSEYSFTHVLTMHFSRIFQTLITTTCYSVSVMLKTYYIHLCILHSTTLYLQQTQANPTEHEHG
jgi:hypothetical protein